MLELYMRLFEARSVNFESCGSAHGIGRDEILGAAATATKQHTLGNRVVLAEMGDAHSLTELDRWVSTIIPGLSDKVVSVVMGRPLPAQLEKLVYASPRYDRARRKAREYHVLAEHHAKKGDEKEVIKYKAMAKEVTDTARQRVIDDIMTNGKCPKCRGTGVTERKNHQCPACHGRGSVIPDITEINKTHGAEVVALFARLVETLQIARSEWVKEFMRQINREKAA